MWKLESTPRCWALQHLQWIKLGQFSPLFLSFSCWIVLWRSRFLPCFHFPFPPRIMSCLWHTCSYVFQFSDRRFASRYMTSVIFVVWLELNQCHNAEAHRVHALRHENSLTNSWRGLLPIRDTCSCNSLSHLSKPCLTAICRQRYS